MQPRTVTHVLCDSWPDDDVPQSAEFAFDCGWWVLIAVAGSFLSWPRPCATTRRRSRCGDCLGNQCLTLQAPVPTVVHCATGSSQTGTFIALMLLTEQLHVRRGIAG